MKPNTFTRIVDYSKALKLKNKTATLEFYDFDVVAEKVEQGLSNISQYAWLTCNILIQDIFIEHLDDGPNPPREYYLSLRLIQRGSKFYEKKSIIESYCKNVIKIIPDDGRPSIILGCEKYLGIITRPISSPEIVFFEHSLITIKGNQGHVLETF